MEKEVTFALLGAGGYGANYISALQKPERPQVRLAAVADPVVRFCPLCPVFENAEELFHHVHPDAVIIASPIPFHAEQAIQACSQGCHVILEKPLAGTPEDGERILEARDRAGKELSVDFQWCYAASMRRLKAEIDSGRLGRPVSMKAIVLFPRNRQYFQKSWAGKKKDAQGRAIYDSVLNNAAAHYLLNMLFLTGEPLTQIEGATFRANEIETYDTVVLKGKSGETDVFLAASHAAGADFAQSPMFEYRFENAIVRFGARGQAGKVVTAAFSNGETEDYGPLPGGFMENLWNMTDVIRGKGEVYCTGETAMLHAKAVADLRKVNPDPWIFDRNELREENGMIMVPGLADRLWRYYDTMSVPEQGKTRS